MLFESQLLTEPSITEADEPAHTSTKAQPVRLSDEEQRYIWALLLKNNFVGRVWPVYTWDDDEPLYELLIDRDLVVRELNEVSDLPISAQQLRTIVARFGGKGTLKSRIDEFYGKRKDRRIRPNSTSPVPTMPRG